MGLETNEELNDIFDELAGSLNISETMRAKAERAYGALGAWLEGNDEGLRADIYTQGSFALGTVVRPPSGEDTDYDIDLVCQMPDLVDSRAEKIKKVVGRRIRQNGTYSGKLAPEGKRCWTLEYDGFHVDVLPCTDDVCRGGSAIRLTHKDPESEEYEDRFSDPRGYKEWFESRMGESLYEARRQYSGKHLCSVDDVPTFLARTPLQKAVQILKHHRNVTFEGLDDAPISIIISTLSAWAYNGEPGVYDAVIGILGRMGQYIRVESGRYRIPNPVDEKENFADKWNEEPKKAEAFFSWLKKARADFEVLNGIRGLDEIGRSLQTSCGKPIAIQAMTGYGERIQGRRNSASLFASPVGLTSAGSAAAKVVPRHEFYGK